MSLTNWDKMEIVPSLNPLGGVFILKGLTNSEKHPLSWSDMPLLFRSLEIMVTWWGTDISDIPDSSANGVCVCLNYKQLTSLLWLWLYNKEQWAKLSNHFKLASQYFPVCRRDGIYQWIDIFPSICDLGQSLPIFFSLPVFCSFI